ncbi:MAG: ATP-binding protein [Lachnospiraceae bacterium]|nr:ATP-binding protein [Lachnospiraceae bacterium]
MGTYLNCGNEAFRMIRRGLYVDKTGLIEYVNNSLGTSRCLTCFSRPRRFGKSYAAAMLAAYYDKSCDSGELFEGLEISRSASYEKHLNTLDVIYLDISWFVSVSSDIQNVVFDIQENVIEELQDAFPGYIKRGEKVLANALLSISQQTKEKFFIIIDEWDALFREAKNREILQESYIRFLRSLFKGGPAIKSAIAGAYMTGILPIKKYGTESALTDFREYSMAKPAKLAGYVGFTEGEVKKLCETYSLDFENVRKWYDGYSFHQIKHVYSPHSVMNAIEYGEFGNYWTSSETYESLVQYIGMNFDGLKDAVVAMLGGGRIRIDTQSFQNDMTSFHSRDDVLTLLIHLGYLAYDEAAREVYIPNLEVAEAFKLAVQNTGWQYVAEALKRSDDLLFATIDRNADAVAAALERIHSDETSILQYNDENSLSCALSIAYYTARNDYTIIRELPSGKGFADLAFIPVRTDKPALLIELKYNKDAEGAIRQIRDRRYDGVLNHYRSNLLLVGINYDKESVDKKHTCVIEKFK